MLVYDDYNSVSQFLNVQAIKKSHNEIKFRNFQLGIWKLYYSLCLYI